MAVPTSLAIPPPTRTKATHTACSPRERLRSIFDTYFDFVWKLVRRLGVPDSLVDDTAQEVFIVASRRLDDIIEGKERAYLVGIAYRLSSQTRRTLLRRREELGEPGWMERASDAPPADELTDLRKARGLLDQVLAAMPTDIRLVFVLFELEGVSLPEIAESLDVPLGTVKSRLRRAREAFDSKLKMLRGAS